VRGKHPLGALASVKGVLADGLIAFHGISSRLVRALRVSPFEALESKCALLLRLTGSRSESTRELPGSCFVPRSVRSGIGISGISPCAGRSTCIENRAA